MVTKDISASGRFDFAAHREQAFKPISGLKDPVIKSLRRVKTSGGRSKEGLFIAEGPDLSARAVKYGATVEALICGEGFVARKVFQDLIALMGPDVPIYTCTEGMLHKCLEAKPTPPCVALVRRVQSSWSPTLETNGQPSLYLGVDEGDNADNLGMLLRTAEAAGVSAALLSGGTVDPWGRRVVRAARGAMFSLPIALEQRSLEAVRVAQAEGIQVITTSAKASHDYTEIDYRAPSLLVVGNEHRGIDEAVVEASDYCVLMPMLGHIHSLNIAGAASLILYEAQRQRGWVSARSRSHA